MITRRLLSLAAAVGCVVTFTAPAFADDFFKGKRIRLYIGATAGGGYDTYGRMFARHFGASVPGNPTVIPQNLPGAGGLVSVNTIYNTAPKDGTALATFNRGIPLDPLTKESKSARFDALKLNWIGSLNRESTVIWSSGKSGIKTAGDLFTKTMIVGVTGSTAESALYATLFNNVLGTKLKIISGYPGSDDINLATQRGELTGGVSSWSTIVSRRAADLKSGEILPLVQISLDKIDGLPDPKIPLVTSLAKSDTGKQIFEMFLAAAEMGRPFTAPPDVPADRVVILRKAFMDMAKSEGFKKDSARAKLDIDPITGEAIQQLLTRIYATPKDVVAQARTAVISKTPFEQVKLVYRSTESTLKAVKGKGKTITFDDGGKTIEVSISGSKTALTIAGAKAKRNGLKAGMACKIEHIGNKSTAKSVACK